MKDLHQLPVPLRVKKVKLRDESDLDPQYKVTFLELEKPIGGLADFKQAEENMQIPEHLKPLFEGADVVILLQYLAFVEVPYDNACFLEVVTNTGDMLPQRMLVHIEQPMISIESMLLQFNMVLWNPELN